MKRRDEEAHKAKHELALQIGEEIVTEMGSKGLSVRKIALAMGYSVGTLYAVFRNFDDLILQLNGRTLDKLYTALSDAEQQQYEQPHACLLALSHAYLQFAIEYRLRWSMVFEPRVTREPEVPSWYQEKVSRLPSLFEKPLQALMPTLEPKAYAQITRALWGNVHGICILALTEKFEDMNVDAIKKMLDLSVNAFLSGLNSSLA
ncbi:MAG TPA: TetR/AcrR family transcriptional regulator [Thioploca sp.]|nr:MAG: TetR/AcrR family transcriptional regulator [Gammaproteobacteria bacterium]HDN27236.1 TetR/AcrR family transcriptional regulator [Thioploca sp.]